MATNFHADLPNDQIHNPKDFNLARKNSILTKDSAGLLKWTPSPYLLNINITFIDDVEGSLNNKYWLLYSSNNENVYRVIYRIAGTLESESIDLGVVVPVFIEINDTASDIATATQFALQELSFQVEQTENTLNITSVISANKPEFFSLQGVFPYTCTESPISNHVLKTDLNGKIVFVPDINVAIDRNFTYTHNQNSSSSEWLINHDLNKFPSVTVVDNEQNVVIGEVTYLGLNSLKINFSSKGLPTLFFGKAYLN